MKTLSYIVVLFLALGLTSCGSTRIIADDARAEIYANGRYEGMGTARIPRTGLPQTLDIELVRSGKQVGNVTIRRRFDGATALSGLFTYGAGLLFCWRYPKEIHVPANKTSWVDGRSIWELPPGQYRDSKAPGQQ